MLDKEHLSPRTVLDILDHEIRTERTVIESGAQTLIRHQATLTPEEMRLGLEDIARAGGNLGQIVQVLKDLFGGSLEPEPLILPNLIPLIVDDFVYSTHRVVELPKTPDMTRSIVMFDKVSLRMVLTNLLKNADKYSPEGLPVSVGVEENDDEIIVSVSNFSEGVTPEDLENIFELRFRTQSAKDSKVEGSGLGLAICKFAVEEQNGRIWAEKEGTAITFSFILPKAPILPE